MTLGFGSRIGSRDRVFFVRQLALLVQSGVSLSEGLIIVGDLTANLALRRAISAISLDIQNGYALSVAAERYPNLFDQTAVAMMKSGEASGQLTLILAQMADEFEREQNLTTKVHAALIYPAFVVGVMVVVAIILTTVIVPRLREVFNDVVVDLPWTTRLVLALSTVLTRYWYILLLIIAVIVYTFSRLVATSGGREVLVRLESRLPVIASLAENSHLTRLARVLGMLLKAGVPIADAIAIVGQSSGNPLWQAALTTVRAEIERGVPLSVALGRHRFFPRPLVEMIAVGEHTGQMDTTLLNMAGFYEQQTDAAIKSFTTLLEPAIILIVAVGVGFLVAAVIMPIYNLAQLQ